MRRRRQRAKDVCQKCCTFCRPGMLTMSDVCSRSTSRAVDATPSNDLPTSLHICMYARVECLLNCFLNSGSLSGSTVHLEPSWQSGWNRTCSGSMVIPCAPAPTAQILAYQDDRRGCADTSAAIRPAADHRGVDTDDPPSTPLPTTPILAQRLVSGKRHRLEAI